MKTPARDDQARAGAEYEQGDLFGDCHFTPAFPAAATQAEIALNSMLKGERLRQPSWLHIGWLLAAAIQELKYLGWPDTSDSIHIEGRKRPIAEYRLPTWVLREIGGTHGQ